jgi:hypothetical protein
MHKRKPEVGDVIRNKKDYIGILYEIISIYPKYLCFKESGGYGSMDLEIDGSLHKNWIYQNPPKKALKLIGKFFELGSGDTKLYFYVKDIEINESFVWATGTSYSTYYALPSGDLEYRVFLNEDGSFYERIEKIEYDPRPIAFRLLGKNTSIGKITALNLDKIYDEGFIYFYVDFKEIAYRLNLDGTLPKNTKLRRI